MFELKVQVKSANVLTGSGQDVVNFELIDAPNQSPDRPEWGCALTAHCAAGHGVAWLSALGIPMSIVNVVKRSGL